MALSKTSEIDIELHRKLLERHIVLHCLAQFDKTALERLLGSPLLILF